MVYLNKPSSMICLMTNKGHLYGIWMDAGLMMLGWNKEEDQEPMQEKTSYGSQRLFLHGKVQTLFWKLKD